MLPTKVQTRSWVYITGYTTRGRIRSDRPFPLHRASTQERIKVTEPVVCKHILCDERSVSCSGIDA